MLENIICAFIAIFAVWGVIGAVYTLLLAFIAPKKDRKTVITVFPRGENAVSDVSFILSKLYVSGDIKRCVIAAVCDDNDAETVSALISAFGDEKRVVVCGRERFIEEFLM
ncbi:MAG: hypothetical protein J1E34_07285 [Oscillospiraceae bacterium]|nr:hypothetical protein [Oscillospiraceae bacterium]